MQRPKDNEKTFTTEIFSLFGSGPVLEAHADFPEAAIKNQRDIQKRRAMLAMACLLLSAGAIAATTWYRTADSEVWAQESRSGILNLPGGFGVVEPIY